MKRIIVILIALGASLLTNVQAQTNHEEILPPAKEQLDQDAPFVQVEEMPEYPGGDKALYKYLGDNINYPKKSKNNGIAGTVYVYFVIDKEGNVKDVEVKRGVPDGEDLGEEAIRVIKAMPKWKPGHQSGKKVNVQFTMPIKFTLQDNKEKKK